jgi:hypothetical protein
VDRRYAGLFFTLCVDVNDNELGCLEAIHLFVEILDQYFGNVCELDLVFNFHKVVCVAYVCVYVTVCFRARASVRVRASVFACVNDFSKPPFLMIFQNLLFQSLNTEVGNQNDVGQ